MEPRTQLSLSPQVGGLGQGWGGPGPAPHPLSSPALAILKTEPAFTGEGARLSRNPGPEHLAAGLKFLSPAPAPCRNTQGSAREDRTEPCVKGSFSEEGVPEMRPEGQAHSRPGRCSPRLLFTYCHYYCWFSETGCDLGRTWPCCSPGSRHPLGLPCGMEPLFLRLSLCVTSWSSLRPDSMVPVQGLRSCRGPFVQRAGPRTRVTGRVGALWAGCRLRNFMGAGRGWKSQHPQSLGRAPGCVTADFPFAGPGNESEGQGDLSPSPGEPDHWPRAQGPRWQLGSSLCSLPQGTAQPSVPEVPGEGTGVTP